MKFLDTIMDELSDKAPLLLAGVAIAGVGFAIYETIKAAPEAEKVKEELEKEEVEDVKEKVKRYVPVYAKPIAIGLATGVCIFTSAYLGRKAQIELLGSYILLEQGFKQYEDKVRELFGVEKEADVRHELAKDEARKHLHPMDDDEESDLILFYDEMSLRYFRDTLENVLSAEMGINSKLNENQYVDQNSFYELIDNDELPPTNEGAINGWSLWHGEANRKHTFLEFTHEKVVLDDGMECTYIHVSVKPYADYLW